MNFLEDNIGKILIAVSVICIILVIVLSIEEENEWREFKKSHECKIVSHVSSSTNVGYGITANGTVGTLVNTTPSQTGWECNDGVTYYR